MLFITDRDHCLAINFGSAGCCLVPDG